MWNKSYTTVGSSITIIIIIWGLTNVLTALCSKVCVCVRYQELMSCHRPARENSSAGVNWGWSPIMGKWAGLYLYSCQTSPLNFIGWWLGTITGLLLFFFWLIAWSTLQLYLSGILKHWVNVDVLNKHIICECDPRACVDALWAEPRCHAILSSSGDCCSQLTIINFIYKLNRKIYHSWHRDGHIDYRGLSRLIITTPVTCALEVITWLGGLHYRVAHCANFPGIIFQPPFFRLC